MPPPPRPPLTIHPTAHIADKASVTGTYPITVGASAVIHPFARLVSARGPIEVGDGAVVWERACVGEVGGAKETVTRLGRNVVVEGNGVVEAGADVGEGTVVEVGARVGGGCVIGEVSSVSRRVSRSLATS